MKSRIKKTQDNYLLPAYLHVFNGRIGKHNSKLNIPVTKSIKEAIKSMKVKRRWESVNGRALQYFIHHMSLIVNEIESPFPTPANISSLLYDNFTFLQGNLNLPN